jgi:hypothetical protein
MPYIPDEQINVGSFVPTTNIWDIQRLFEIDIQTPDFKELLVRLYQNINNIAICLNTKDSGFYVTEQFVTGKLWFNQLSSKLEDLRGCFRKVINIGALPAGVTLVPHDLSPTTEWKFTSINGVASNTTQLATLAYYPLPFVGTSGFIELRVDRINVIINNTTGVVFTHAYVVLEFLKS